MPTPYRRQRGLSLVELMVALVIGSLLILGATQLYLNNKAHFRFQQGQLVNQENGRYAFLLLDQQLARTGYRYLPQDSLESAFPSLGSSNGCPAFSAGQTFQLTSDGNGICLRYQGASDETTQSSGSTGVRDQYDCQGNFIPRGASILTRISYVAGSTPDTGSLTCSAQGATAQTLITGLAGFVFFPLPAKTEATLSASYAALLASGAVNRGGMASDVASRWKTFTGKTLSEDTSYAYQIAQGSVMFRNLMP
ncbi:PilW family protein [Pseudomonas citronellolis]|uniref:PilW family protein n=1 Tax=Pseudomonas citronellolis TaxID=53408 RepID=UPI0023E45D32|nr:prepilin-type N-terminal cleavage/methylation domain-containing protein [Pseudomonas citronellolis]MDF3931616.1 prepilin-type N-terminal cleavage/methylation domain-containing protein [Pseudomonas citronellolis]